MILRVVLIVMTRAKQTLSWTRQDDYCEVDSPICYFRKFFRISLIESVVEQSSLYSVQRDNNRPLSLNIDELVQFMGWCVLCRYMGYHGLACIGQ